MNNERRNFLGMLGLGALFMAGCNSISDPGSYTMVNNQPPAPKPTPETPEIAEDYPVTPYKPLDWSKLEAPTPAVPGGIAVLDSALPRSTWADAAPITDRLRPMQTPWRETLHHSGVFCDTTNRQEIIEILRGFRRHHLAAFHAGDIGYHYIIDRTGTLWIGRELKYQGAHVKDHNEGNIGVMVMGDFEQQDPTRAQIEKVQAVMPALMKRYNIVMPHVYTHRELMPTLCPGRSLQADFNGMRKRNFA
ncbi:MAG: N-acetylmuramoyl-L-alanine amidase [Planctomycetota bacterium]